MTRVSLPAAGLTLVALFAPLLIFGGPSRVVPNPKDPQYQAKGDQKRTYIFPGTDESIPYRLYVPAKWNKKTKLPLVLVLHGANQSQDMPFERGDGVLPKIAEERGYIIASVLGYRRNANYNNPFPLVPATPVAASPAKAPPMRRGVRFAARASGHDPAGTDDALERVGLLRVADVAHGRLSQGQRRRLSLANAIVRRPKLLLLDEPHAGLDEQGRAVLEAVVRAAPGDGCTVLIASHELELARGLATREVQIVAGQVREPSRSEVVV